MSQQARDPLKSTLFVLIQFISLALIGLTGPLLAGSPVLLALELGGIALGIWAVGAMKIGHFNIAPDPLSWSKLVRRGPYRLIRHPMYLALLLTTLPLVSDHFTPARLAVWLILLFNLLLKLNYEESLLADQLEGYRQYTSESYRLIPFLY